MNMQQDLFTPASPTTGQHQPGHQAAAPRAQDPASATPQPSPATGQPKPQPGHQAHAPRAQEPTSAKTPPSPATGQPQPQPGHQAAAPRAQEPASATPPASPATGQPQPQPGHQAAAPRAQEPASATPQPSPATGQQQPQPGHEAAATRAQEPASATPHPGQPAGQVCQNGTPPPPATAGARRRTGAGARADIRTAAEYRTTPNDRTDRTDRTNRTDRTRGAIVRKGEPCALSAQAVAQMRVPVCLGNSGGTPGQLDGVGYVLINSATGEFIPVAHGDEHRSGWDLWHFLQDGGIVSDADNWYPVWVCSGIQCLFNAEDAPRARAAFAAWIAWGGDETSIVYCYYNQTLYSVRSFADNAGGSATQGATPYAAEILSLLSRARECYISNDLAGCCRRAFRLAEVLGRDWYYICAEAAPVDRLQAIGREIFRAEDTGDNERAGRALFAWDGLKNTLHNALKRLQAARGDNADRARTIWGDVGLMIAALAALDSRNAD